jgi:hypothetical protein
MGGRVVEAKPLEALGSLSGQAAIVGTGGEDDEAGAQLLSVLQLELPQAVALGLGEATASVGAGYHGAELPRLKRRPLSQV